MNEKIERKCTMCGSKELQSISLATSDDAVRVFAYQCKKCNHIELFGSKLPSAKKVSNDKFVG